MGEQVQPVRVSRDWEERAYPSCLGERVQPVRASRGWEDRGSPWCFGGAGTGYEGEQGAGRTRGAPGVSGSRYSLRG